MPTLFASPCLAVAVLAAPLAVEPLHAAVPPIEAIAPETSVLVAAVDDMGAFARHLEALGLKEAGGARLFDAIAVAPGDGAGPRAAGAASVALYTVPGGEFDLPVPAFMLTADFGAKADEMDARIQEAFARVADETGRVEGGRTIRGRAVRTIEVASPERAEMLQALMPPEIAGVFDFRQFLGDTAEAAFLVREGDAFMISSDLGTLDRALGVADGGDLGPARGLATRGDFLRMREALGAQDAWAVTMTRDLGSFLAANDPMGVTMMIGPMFGQVFGPVNGFATGVRFETPRARLEKTALLYMPHGRAGLSSLMDRTAPRTPPPTFVPGDASGYLTMSFDFRGMPRALAPVVQMMQMMMPPDPQAPPEGPLPGELLEQGSRYLGSRFHVVLAHPAGGAPEVPLLAVEASEPDDLRAFLALVGPMNGMRKREVEGHRLWEANLAGLGMLLPVEVPADALARHAPAAAVGAGHLFLGPRHAVLAALRAAAAPPAPAARLEASASFVRAMALVRNRPVAGWAFFDADAAMSGAAELAALGRNLGAGGMVVEPTEMGFVMRSWMAPRVD